MSCIVPSFSIPRLHSAFISSQQNAQTHRPSPGPDRAKVNITPCLPSFAHLLTSLPSRLSPRSYQKGYFLKLTSLSVAFLLANTSHPTLSLMSSLILRLALQIASQSGPDFAFLKLLAPSLHSLLPPPQRRAGSYMPGSSPVSPGVSC